MDEKARPKMDELARGVERDEWRVMVGANASISMWDESEARARCCWSTLAGTKVVHTHESPRATIGPVGGLSLSFAGGH